MFTPAHLRTLAAVCETGSFELAAARVHVTPSAVSQRMRALSETAGGPLFERLQPARPTALGRRLLRHASDLAALEAGLMADLSLSAGPRPVAVAINADSLETWAVDALAAAEGYRFDVVIDDQDHSVELLRRGEVSAVVAGTALPVPGCDAFALGTLRYRATCSPGFAARWFPEGPTAEALARAPVLRFDAKDALQSRWIEAVTGGTAHPPAHRIAATSPFVRATRAGLGWGMNPEPLVARDLAAGRLVELAPDRPLDTALHWHVARAMAPALAPLTRAVRDAARAGLRR
jgi:LysR family transcriptional regulator (chromosome initiation inhibitor)